MSNFDIAVGLDERELSRLLSELLDHPGVQQKIARGSTQTDTPAGKIHISWEILEPPRISFEPVDADRWRGAVKGLHDRTLPQENVFTLICPRLRASLQYSDGAREEDIIEAHLYAHLDMAEGAITLDPYGVWVDPAALSEIQPSAMNALLFFGLEMAEEALRAISLPSWPKELGLDLGPPTALVEGRRLLLGACLTPGEVDLSDEPWPDEGLFLLASHDLVNGLVRGQLHRVLGKTFTWRREGLRGSGRRGAAVVEGSLEVLEADVQVDGRELTRLGGAGRVTLRASALLSLLEALGLSALVRLLERLHLAWVGLGYSARPVPSRVHLGAELLLDDRRVAARIGGLRRCVALLWPRGSLPTILLSVALWPLAQLLAVLVPLVLVARYNRARPMLDLLEVPNVEVTLLGSPLTIALQGLSAATFRSRLLLGANVDLRVPR